MKKTILFAGFLLLVNWSFGAEEPILAIVPAPGTTVQETAPAVSRADLRKAFKERRKLISKLVKAYHKAAPEEQPAILAQLQEVVAQNTQAGLSYMKERIAAERANLDSWEAKVKQDEQNIAALNEQRVAELLSKDAKKQYKARRKAWKKQLKEARKKMRG